MPGYDIIKEGKAVIKVPGSKIITKKVEVFYNPIMKTNRDLSVVLLKALSRKNMRIGLPLSGTGIRGIRFLKELPRSMIEEIHLNDLSPGAIKHIKANLKANKVSDRAVVCNKDANRFLLESKGFDYIDVDPFGSPNPFLDAAIVRLAREGILGVTATDTAPLCGTYTKACKRKYWASPLRNEFMHESGLRILIRKVQLIGAQYDKALLPILSLSQDHYFRVFFHCEKSKSKVDEVIGQHRTILYDQRTLDRRIVSKSLRDLASHQMLIGPMWTGQLHDLKILKGMLDVKESYGQEGLLRILAKESRISAPGHHDLHAIARKYKMGNPLPMAEVFRRLKKAGIRAAPTHFSTTGFICEAPIMDIVKAFGITK